MKRLRKFQRSLHHRRHRARAAGYTASKARYLKTNPHAGSEPWLVALGVHGQPLHHGFTAANLSMASYAFS